jgi:dTMP kinase
MEMYGKHSVPGRLFVVEGIDGSGKSTQLALLHRWLESEGYATVFTEWNSSPDNIFYLRAGGDKLVTRALQ